MHTHTHAHTHKHTPTENLPFSGTSRHSHIWLNCSIGLLDETMGWAVVGKTHVHEIHAPEAEKATTEVVWLVGPARDPTNPTESNGSATSTTRALTAAPAGPTRATCGSSRTFEDMTM